MRVTPSFRSIFATNHEHAITWSRHDYRHFREQELHVPAYTPPRANCSLGSSSHLLLKTCRSLFLACSHPLLYDTFQEQHQYVQQAG